VPACYTPNHTSNMHLTTPPCTTHIARVESSTQHATAAPTNKQPHLTPFHPSPPDRLLPTTAWLPLLDPAEGPPSKQKQPIPTRADAAAEGSPTDAPTKDLKLPRHCSGNRTYTVVIADWQWIDTPSKAAVSTQHKAHCRPAHQQVALETICWRETTWVGAPSTAELHTRTPATAPAPQPTTVTHIPRNTYQPPLPQIHWCPKTDVDALTSPQRTPDHRKRKKLRQLI
jgi:hypothetical protein